MADRERTRYYTKKFHSSIAKNTLVRTRHGGGLGGRAGWVVKSNTFVFAFKMETQDKASSHIYVQGLQVHSILLRMILS